MYVRLLRCLEHVYVVELDLTHVRGAIRKHDAGTRVEVGVAQRRRRRVLILVLHVDAIRALDISLNIGNARLAFDVLARDRAQLHLDVGPVLGLIGAQLFGCEAAERPPDLGLLARSHEELEPRRQQRELAGDDVQQRLLRLLGQLVERARARRG